MGKADGNKRKPLRGRASIFSQFERWLERGLTQDQAAILCRHEHGGRGNVLKHTAEGLYCWSFAGPDEEDEGYEEGLPLSDAERHAVEALCRMEFLECNQEGFFLDGPMLRPDSVAPDEGSGRGEVGGSPSP